MDSSSAQSTGAAAASRPAEAPRAVIWDLDGTIVDTESLSTDAINHTLARFGAFCDAALKREITGTRRDFWTKMILERCGIPETSITPAQLGDEWEARCTELAPTARLMPGVDALTAGLASLGVSQGIATSSTRAAAKLAPHPQVAARMATIVTGNMVTRGKPAPDIFLLAAEQLGADPSVCIVLEDSPIGVAAGKAAGMTVVAVPDPSIAIPKELFWEAGADVMVDSLEGLDPAVLLAARRK
jgi:HAD superfamily hydrolase (TIGR01509 family)